MTRIRIRSKRLKNKSLWALSVLFGSILAFLVWGGFEMPVIARESKKVNGRIIAVFPSNEVRTYKRGVKYAYTVDGKSYIDFKKPGTKTEKQFIGNQVLVSYAVNNPESNRVVKFFNDHKRFREIKFYSNLEYGFIELRLINGVFKYKKYANGGKLINSFVGDYTISGDSLKLNHYYFEKDSITIARPELFVEDKNVFDQINEVGTNRAFKRVKDRW